MKTSKLLLVAALLLGASVPLFAQVNDTYVIPAAANARGAFGTHWMTRFSIFNPHLEYPLRVSITYVPSGGAQGIEDYVDVPANSLAYSDNILEDLFGVTSGTGALLVATFADDNPGVPDDVLSQSFLVNSETFNNVSAGTYGQTIPGVWSGLMDYDTDGISAVAHGIRNAGLFRTNFGAVNLGRCTVTLLVNIYDADGNTIREGVPFLVPPLGHMQDSLPVAVTNGSAEFFVDDPCANNNDNFAVVFPYTSTIDQRSGDPAYQSPTLLASPNVLFAKGQKIDSLTIGKKIDSTYARRVRNAATRLGKASLTKTVEGWQITR